MVYTTLLYFVLLFCYFLRKNRTIDLAAGICLIYIVTSLFAVLIDVFDLYGDYGINIKTESVSATVVYCVGLTLVVYPFSLLKIKRIPRIGLRKPLLFDLVCYCIVLCSIISLLWNGKDIVRALTMEAADVKSEHYERLSFRTEESQPFYMYICNVVVHSASFILGVWFFTITFLKKRAIFHLPILIASMSKVLIDSMTAGRSSIIYWMFNFFIFLCFFSHFMDRRSLMKIYRTAMVFGGLAVTYFVIITISRFADRADNAALYSFVGYAGQMYNNFCTFFEYCSNLPITIERILPITYKYVFNGNFDLLEFYSRIQAVTGVYVACFSTLLGGLYINIGFWGMWGYLLFFFFLAVKAIKQFHKHLDFSNLILLFILLIVPIKGVFGLPFTHVTDSLSLLFLSFLYVIFKYTFKFR